MGFEDSLGKLAFISVLLACIVLVPAAWAEDAQGHGGVMGWIVDNKEWLFSGVALTVLSWAGRYILDRRRKSKQTSPQTQPHNPPPSQQQTSGSGSQNFQGENLQAGRDIIISVAFHYS